MRRTVIFLFILFVIGIIMYGVYYFINNFSYTRHIDLPSQLLASTSTLSTSTNNGGLNVSTSTDVFDQIDPSLLIPASSTIDSSQWLSYVDKSNSFSIKYPSNFIINTDTPGSVVFFLPKDKYFKWPLLDEVKISVVATSSCPMVIAGNIGSSTITTVANGYSFVRVEGSDIGAGNLYREMAFDTNNQNTCYHIDLFDHGTNGAGFYVSDQSLISRYDNEHNMALDNVVSIFIGMVNSFHITE